MGYEFRSRQRVFGLPLVHVTWGVDPFTGRARVSRGVIAVGPVALGGIAVGPVAVGVVALGQVSCGAALAAGQLAAGIWSLGQVALGKAHAWGQVALASTADGWIALGEPRASFVLGALWSAVAFFCAHHWWRRSRRLLPLVAPTVSLDLTAPGLAVVRGRIVPRRTVQAPISHRAVVAYDVSRVRDGEEARTERRCEDFYVEDPSGRARILGADAELVLAPVESESIETRVVATEVAGAGLGAQIVQAVGTAFERVLLPGDEVVVLGHALRTVGSGRCQLALHGGAGGPILVTNRDPSELRAEAQLVLWLAILLWVAAFLAPLVQLPA